MGGPGQEVVEMEGVVQLEVVDLEGWSPEDVDPDQEVVDLEAVVD